MRLRGRGCGQPSVKRRKTPLSVEREGLLKGPSLCCSTGRVGEPEKEDEKGGFKKEGNRVL